MTQPTSRLFLLGGAAVCAFAQARAASDPRSEDAATFVFISDVHACRMGAGLSPNCQQEGKTDANLLRHIHAINALLLARWPTTVAGRPSGLHNAGQRIGEPRGVIVGGDMTDDGGGQTAEREEGSQILQFSHRYRQGTGPDNIHFPVYAGLGNHDLDQDGRPPDIDWYRDELRDYVRYNHEPSPFFKPAVPVASFDDASESYSWDWEPLHLVQLHRFGGDTRHGAASGLDWLKRDLAAVPHRRPVAIFQHYGWDSFSTEKWDPAKSTFDDHGPGAAHWWSESDRAALLDVLDGANVIGIFHGHQHETPMIYREKSIDLFKPKAAFMGGFAVAVVSGSTFEVALGEASDDHGGIAFSDAFSKQIDI